MNRSTMRAFGVVGVVAFGLAGCSGDDDASPTTVSTTDVTTTTVSTTVAATEPTDPTTTSVPSTPATTEPVSTTEPETSTPPTTLPDGVPPRVTFPDDPDLQAVVDAFYAFSDASSAALVDPSDEELASAFLDTTVDPLRSRAVEIIADLVASGEVFRTRVDQPAYVDIVESTVIVVDDSAGFDGCSINTDIRVEPGGNPDGSDRIVDDSISSSFLSYQLQRVDGEWKISNVVRVDSFEGQIGCD